MSRTAIPLQVADLSPFAKSLRQSLASHDGTPTHVELLNMLARAAGFANYQHLRADAEAADRLQAAAEPGPRADLGQVEKARPSPLGKGCTSPLPLSRHPRA